MPKEITRGVSTFGASTEEVVCPVVDIRWSRYPDSHVQIVTRVYDAEIPGLDEHNPIPVEYGYYVELGRDAINKLIRDLRRARDQAFGSDE